MEIVDEIIEKVRTENRKYLMEHEAKKICEAYGIPITKFKVAKNIKEAIKFANEIGYPVVFKIISPDIIHKTDVGGVILDIKND
ncbi:MAG TPA: hypothetical protein EYP16_04085 [Candidatus Atribacteria bacterium]|nr:hypothetical protein [Candidatus Atribacteria bacterium]